MFDIGWMELAIVAILALIVIGPKDLPRVLRTVGGVVRKAQGLAREFRGTLDEMAREADLDDARKAIQSAAGFDLDGALKDAVDPAGEIERDLRSDPLAEENAIGAPRAESAPATALAAASPDPQPAAAPSTKKPPRRMGGAQPKIDRPQDPT